MKNLEEQIQKILNCDGVGCDPDHIKIELLELIKQWALEMVGNDVVKDGFVNTYGEAIMIGINMEKEATRSKIKELIK